MSDWEWELTDTSRRDFDGLDDHARDRITNKLDEIVTDQWREPPEHLEPLQGTPHQKLRIGPFRLGCRVDRSEQTLYILRIRKRGGDAYRSDDDGSRRIFHPAVHLGRVARGSQRSADGGPRGTRTRTVSPRSIGRTIGDGYAPAYGSPRLDPVRQSVALETVAGASESMP